MATVIDSLLIELGLDSSKFMASQKKVIDALKEIQEENEKTSKSVADNEKKTTVENKKSADENKKNSIDKKKAAEEEKKAGEQSTKIAKENHLNTKKTVDGFSKTRDALMSLGTAYLGLAGIKSLSNMIDDVAKNTSELSRQSTLLGVPSKDLQSWGAVGKVVGAAEKDVISSLQNIQSAMTDFATSGGGVEAQKALQYLRLDPKDIANFDVVSAKVKEYIAATKDVMPGGETAAMQRAFKYTMEIGYNEATFKMLMLGPDQLGKLHDKFAELSHLTPQLIEKSNQYNESIAILSQSFTGLLNILANTNMPFLTLLSNGLSNAIEFVDKLIIKIDKFDPFGLNKWILSHLPSSAPNTSAGGPITNPDVARKSFSDIDKENKLPTGTIDFLYKQESAGGKGSMVSSAGATGPFQLMPSTAAAFGMSREDTFDTAKSSKAAGSLMGRLLVKYKGDIDKALAGYNWGEGNVDKKGMGHLPEETKKYIANYHNMIGAGTNAPTNTNNSRSQSTQVSINGMTINTAATDANGIAKTIPEAMNQNINSYNGTRTLN